MVVFHFLPLLLSETVGFNNILHKEQVICHMMLSEETVESILFPYMPLCWNASEICLHSFSHLTFFAVYFKYLNMQYYLCFKFRFQTIYKLFPIASLLLLYFLSGRSAADSYRSAARVLLRTGPYREENSAR